MSRRGVTPRLKGIATLLFFQQKFTDGVGDHINILDRSWFFVWHMHPLENWQIRILEDRAEIGYRLSAVPYLLGSEKIKIYPDYAASPGEW